MERFSKEVFISIKTREIEMLRDFIKSIGVLKAYAQKYDGKVLNKRYIDAMNVEINKVVPAYGEGKNTFQSIYLYFDKNWNDVRRNRLVLLHNNRWCEDSRAYVQDNTRTMFELYKGEDGKNVPYIDENTFRLNTYIFVNTLDLWRVELQEAINEKKRRHRQG